VVGVDRVHHAAALREHGADVVVDDLGELILGDGAVGGDDGASS
jgi:phosphoglycolate phosphatase-like HAD superfamily hydrolase